MESIPHTNIFDKCSNEPQNKTRFFNKFQLQFKPPNINVKTMSQVQSELSGRSSADGGKTLAHEESHQRSVRYSPYPAMNPTTEKFGRRDGSRDRRPSGRYDGVNKKHLARSPCGSGRGGKYMNRRREMIDRNTGWRGFKPNFQRSSNAYQNRNDRQDNYKARGMQRRYRRPTEYNTTDTFEYRERQNQQMYENFEEMKFCTGQSSSNTVDDRRSRCGTVYWDFGASDNDDSDNPDYKMTLSERIEKIFGSTTRTQIFTTEQPPAVPASEQLNERNTCVQRPLRSNVKPHRDVSCDQKASSLHRESSNSTQNSRIDEPDFDELMIAPFYDTEQLKELINFEISSIVDSPRDNKDQMVSNCVFGARKTPASPHDHARKMQTRSAPVRDIPVREDNHVVPIETLHPLPVVSAYEDIGETAETDTSLTKRLLANCKPLTLNSNNTVMYYKNGPPPSLAADPPVVTMVAGEVSVPQVTAEHKSITEKKGRKHEGKAHDQKLNNFDNERDKKLKKNENVSGSEPVKKCKKMSKDQKIGRAEGNDEAVAIEKRKRVNDVGNAGKTHETGKSDKKRLSLRSEYAEYSCETDKGCKTEKTDKSKKTVRLGNSDSASKTEKASRGEVSSRIKKNAKAENAPISGKPTNKIFGSKDESSGSKKNEKKRETVAEEKSKSKTGKTAKSSVNLTIKDTKTKSVHRMSLRKRNQNGVYSSFSIDEELLAFEKEDNQTDAQSSPDSDEESSKTASPVANFPSRSKCPVMTSEELEQLPKTSSSFGDHSGKNTISKRRSSASPVKKMSVNSTKSPALETHSKAPNDNCHDPKETPINSNSSEHSEMSVTTYQSQLSTSGTSAANKDVVPVFPNTANPHVGSPHFPFGAQSWQQAFESAWKQAWHQAWQQAWKQAWSQAWQQACRQAGPPAWPQVQQQGLQQSGLEEGLTPESLANSIAAPLAGPLSGQSSGQPTGPPTGPITKTPPWILGGLQSWSPAQHQAWHQIQKEAWQQTRLQAGLQSGLLPAPFAASLAGSQMRPQIELPTAPEPEPPVRQETERAPAKEQELQESEDESWKQSGPLIPSDIIPLAGRNAGKQAEKQGKQREELRAGSPERQVVVPTSAPKKPSVTSGFNWCFRGS